MKPRATKADAKPGGDYFPARDIAFIRSGCALLDCVAGGGWPLGRIVNIVGDKSAGKTLLAIEGAANFSRQYPKGKIWYREAEAAFDLDYASDVGLPRKQVDFGPDGIETLWNTIEDIFEDLRKCVAHCQKHSVPGLYIIDSLDALSSRAEIGRDISKGTYQLDKQKLLSELFRVLARDIKHANILVIVVSQVRDKIGFVVGKKHTRSGGKALDFYASVILWLTHIKTLTRTVNKVTRPTGILVEAKAEKNKMGPPLRKCQFKLRFGYGVDDSASSLDWLEEVGKLKLLQIGASDIGKYLASAETMSDDERREFGETVRNAVVKAWAEVEADFKPKRQKYADAR